MEAPVVSSASKPTSTAKNPRLRSRVSNGKRTFVEGDGRSPWARRWRDLIEAHIGDLGGTASLSTAQRSLIQRASTLEIELEQIEGRLSLGKPADLGLYATCASHLRRIFEVLGVKRQARDMGDLVDNMSHEFWSPLRQQMHDEATDVTDVSDG